MLKEQIIQTEQADPVVMPEPKKVTPEHRTPHWFEDDHSDAYTGKCRSVVKDFVAGSLIGKRSIINKNFRHIYTTRKNGSELWPYKNNAAITFRICVAKNVNGLFLGNANNKHKPNNCSGWW